MLPVLYFVYWFLKTHWIGDCPITKRIAKFINRSETDRENTNLTSGPGQ